MNLRTIGCRKMISNSLVLDLMSYVRGDSAGENQMGKWKHVSKWSTSVLFICVKCGKEGPAQMKRRCSPCHEAQCHNTWIRWGKDENMRSIQGVHNLVGLWHKCGISNTMWGICRCPAYDLWMVARPSGVSGINASQMGRKHTILSSGCSLQRLRWWEGQVESNTKVQINGRFKIQKQWVYIFQSTDIYACDHKH